MISRVAENCFWMLRYMERADHTARLLRVNHNFLLDVELPELERWHPLIVVAGEQQRFEQIFPNQDTSQGHTVLNYLTWDERNPTSILNSISSVRENARTIRDVVSLEMWETINSCWHWLTNGEGQHTFSRDVGEFMNRVTELSALFHGLLHDTVSHDTPFVFMRLGMLLERAGQTARILDVKHHTLGPGTGSIETPVEAAQWVALLRSCSATESFLKKSTGAPTGQTVLQFLLHDDGFPRSVSHCLNRALSLLRHLEESQRNPNERRSTGLLQPLVEHLQQQNLHTLLPADVHQVLTDIIDSTSAVCSAVHSDYFDPPARTVAVEQTFTATRASTEFPREAPPLRDISSLGESQFVTPMTPPLSVVHETVYTYDRPVTHSTHVFRLRPVHDEGQRLSSFELVTNPPGAQLSYEDVFGNTAIQVDIDGPYQELRIESRSRVTIQPTAQVVARGKTTIPLLWMPWQRQMMLPYLLPMELPESHLRKLYDYAMSFVIEAKFDLVETLMAINKTIHEEYAYVSGSTTIETTPYEVFHNKRGVCQDFANLMICLAQLLNVPARYRVGYIYTGGDYENKIQSEASHAWAELYLPWIGWRGFDPTNGCLTGPDHVRVAAGRNYRDATPTSGTFYGQTTAESLAVAVRITQGGEQ